MNYVKYIYDSIHGNIGITDIELKIIDTKIFQRLHRIKQLGPADMVYPGATHSRFAHSLGAMFVMDQYLQNVKVEDSPITELPEDKQKLRLAALLHDVGHYPFSHSLEVPITEKFGGHKHDRHSIHIIETILAEKLDTYTPSEITKIIDKKFPNHIYSTLISSEMDVDKVDYLLRDSYYTGVGYGNVDVDRLLRTLSFDSEGKIVFQKGGPVIENFLLGRYHMFQAVYTHKVVIALEQMIERIYELLVKESKIMHPTDILQSQDELTLSMFDDDYVWQSMIAYYKEKKQGFLTELIDAVLKREPIALSVQKAAPVDKGEFPEGWGNIALLKEEQKKKQELADKASSLEPKSSIDPDWIFTYVNAKPTSVIPDDIPILVKTKQDIIPLDKDESLAIHKLVGLDFHDARIYTKCGYETKVAEAFKQMYAR